jgi:predicted nucleic acid-binding protein
MNAFFLETSALVKRHQQKPKGSAWVRSISDLSSGNELYISDLTRAEVPGAILKKHRREKSDSAKPNRLFKRFFKMFRLTSTSSILLPTLLTTLFNFYSSTL